MVPPTRKDLDTDAHVSSRRLADLLQVLVMDRPHVVEAVERCVRALVVDERREAIADRLQHLDPEQLAELDVLIAQMEKNHFDASEP